MSSADPTLTPSVPEILRHLEASGLRDLAGTRVSAVVPIAASLVNALIAASIPPTAPVRSVAISPESGGRFSVRISPKGVFLPAITLRVAIEEQPDLPESPVLVLRMVTLSGLFGLAGAAISGMLPPGVRLDGERILIDLRALAAERGLAHLLDHVAQLRIMTEDGRLVLHADAAID